jgi:hypothetical protein
MGPRMRNATMTDADRARFAKWLPLPNHNGLSLLSAQDRLRNQIWEGSKCRCCGKYAEIYKTPLGSGMVRSLIWLVRNSEEGQYVHLPTKATRGELTSNSIGKLVHWGLVQPLPNREDPSKNKLGRWRATRLGREFAHDQAKVCQYAILAWPNLLLGLWGEPVSVREALGRKFNYAKLMAGSA